MKQTMSDPSDSSPPVARLRAFFAGQATAARALLARRAELKSALGAVEASIAQMHLPSFLTDGNDAPGVPARITLRQRRQKAHQAAMEAIPAKPNGQTLAAILLDYAARQDAPLRASVVAPQILAGGYQTTSKNFSQVVYQTLKTNKAFKKTADGFVVKK